MFVEINLSRIFSVRKTPIIFKMEEKRTGDLFSSNCMARLLLVYLNKICDLGGKRPFQFTDMFRVYGSLLHLDYSDVKDKLANKSNNPESLYARMFRPL